MSKITRGYIIAVVGTAIWSTTAVFIRYLNVNYRMPPLVLAFWRDLFAALSLGLILAIFAPRLLRLDRRQMGFILGYGFLLACFNAIWTFSVAFNGAAVSTVLVYSSPGFTALLCWWFFKERPSLSTGLVIGLNLLGSIIVAGAYDPKLWQLNLLGIVTGLVSGIAFAVYSLMGKVSANRGLNSWSVLCYTFGAAAVFLLAGNLLAARLGFAGQTANLLWLGNSLPGWGMLALLAVGPTIGGYGLYNLSLTYLKANVSNVIATMEPAFTAVESYLLLAERFTFNQVGGSLMIIASVVLLRIFEGRPAKATESPQDAGAAAAT